MNIAKIKRSLNVRRRRRRIAKIELSPEQIKSLQFYQYSPATADFFQSRKGTTKITTIDTPHYAFASDLAAGKGRSCGAEYYADYIRASWGEKATPAALAAQLNKFEAHFEAFTNGQPAPALRLTKLDEHGPCYTVDGNHRSAFAAALRRSYASEIWPIDLVYLKSAPLNEFYGGGASGVPYQPVYFGGKEIIRGRRSDLQTRLEMLPPSLLEGATLLDVASNIGTNSILALSMGAKSCLGLEVSQNMVTLATRFAVFNGLFPSVRFRQFDIDTDSLGSQESFDGCFMFSIYSHLKNPTKLTELAERHISRFVVFEAHPGGTRSNYEAFLDSGIFRTVTEIGILPTSVKDPRPSRRLWLCER